MRLKFMLVIALSLVTGTLKAQKEEFFTPVRTNMLRLPAVPLVAVDPYFSLWSKYDRLYDGNVSHWNGSAKPLNGAVRVDGETYRFMGSSMESLFPMAQEKAWKGRYTMTTPGSGWETTDFDDQSWPLGDAAWGGNDDAYKYIGTPWNTTNSNVWIRREMELEEVNEKTYYYVMYKHDDVFELYVNGRKLVDTGNTWDVSGGASVKIPAGLLQKGKNIIAAHCFNTTGGAYADMGLYMSLLTEPQQLKCTVMPTSTYYTIRCGGVDLDLVFTTPQVMDDLDLFTTPITYISYQAKSNDGKEHEVSLMLEGTSEMAVRNIDQSTSTRRLNNAQAPSLSLIRTGNTTQNYVSQTSDFIDWGYFYMTSQKTVEGQNLQLGLHQDILRSFCENGTIPTGPYTRTMQGGNPCSIAYTDSLGTVDEKGKRGFTMVGYDDIFSIQYHGINRKAYWSQNGRVTIAKRFETLCNQYDSIMTLCRNTDEKIYDDAKESGGIKYAEICCAGYRQTNAAHKLVTDTKGNLMYMSRENGSGGFINTLDVTYPSQPLYLIYNTSLAKGMLTPILEYSKMGKWTRDFANHDMGSYPKANGQTYGGDMPVEESGNMLILMAVIAHLDRDIDYVNHYWEILTKWTDYLVEHGKDPTNQLCTDDFMGTSERNTNLAIKAILGVMSYAELCRMRGDTATADIYDEKAAEMRNFWTVNAVSYTGGTHYLLNFGADGNTWSTKYNLVWDKAWGWNKFSLVRRREMNFYSSKINTYGLPLDSRGSGCKIDWNIWTGAMSETLSSWNRFLNPVWKYINETPSRVPISDNYWSTGGNMWMFQARSVLGGFWMKLFVDLFSKGELGTSIALPERQDPMQTANGFAPWYDLQGHQVKNLSKGEIYIHEGKKVIHR